MGHDVRQRSLGPKFQLIGLCLQNLIVSDDGDIHLIQTATPDLLVFFILRIASDEYRQF